MRRFLCILFLSAVAVAPVLAQDLGTRLAQGGYLHEEESRFLPGLYSYRKGCEMFRRGDGKGAIGQWTVAASWAVKEAQYNLGIAYYKGQGTAANRPLGVAWLAVAAERRNPEFSESLAAAWMESSADEQRRANELYADLLQRYGDQATLARAKKHFDSELAQVTGSRVGTPGSVSVWSPTYGNLDVAVFRRELQTLADQNFGAAPKGTVRVGDIQIPPETDGE